MGVNVTLPQDGKVYLFKTEFIQKRYKLACEEQSRLELALP